VFIQDIIVELFLWCITPLSAVFQLYRVRQFYLWRKPEYTDKTTNIQQVTNTIYHKVVSSTHRHVRESSSQL